MGKSKAIKMDDLDLPSYTPDGKSTIDIYSVPEQIAAPDGESTIDVGDYAGIERVTESVQNNVTDLDVPMTSEPTSQDRDDTKSYGTAPVVDPLPPTSAENLNPIQQPTPETSTEDAPKRRGRPAKATATDTAEVPADTDAAKK